MIQPPVFAELSLEVGLRESFAATFICSRENRLAIITYTILLFRMAENNNAKSEKNKISFFYYESGREKMT